jgi:hypothetical protein
MIFVDVSDTKGGQKSIFNDNIEGAFHLKIWRETDAGDLQFLKEKYKHLSEAKFRALMEHLSILNIGEMQPQYIMRYGFYEGHTFWRADPIAIAYIFGIKNIREIESIFPGKLYESLTNHHTEQQKMN